MSEVRIFIGVRSADGSPAGSHESIMEIASSSDDFPPPFPPASTVMDSSNSMRSSTSPLKFSTCMYLILIACFNIAAPSL